MKEYIIYCSIIPNAIGFKSKTSFISLFKKMTGVTPLAYQNKKSNFE